MVDGKINMKIGAKLRIGNFDVLSQCMTCGKYIWVRNHPLEPCEYPDIGERPICVECAVKEVSLANAVNDDPVSEILLDGLMNMHKAGY